MIRVDDSVAVITRLFAIHALDQPADGEINDLHPCRPTVGHLARRSGFESPHGEQNIKKTSAMRGARLRVLPSSPPRRHVQPAHPTPPHPWRRSPLLKVGRVVRKKTQKKPHTRVREKQKIVVCTKLQKQRTPRRRPAHIIANCE